MKTGEISYQRDDILKYMLAINPVENFRSGNKRQKENIMKYYSERSEELADFNVDDYALEDMDLDKFFDQYIARRKEPIAPSTTLAKESLFLPREIGIATVNTSTQSKDEARKHIQRDEQIMQQSQEIDDTKSK